MATRRTTTRIDVPITANGNANANSKQSQPDLDAPPPTGSPFLPTTLEAALLALYPGTLLLGSLFSTLHPASRNATYLPYAQSYDPRDAPSYFAKKSNIFNVYFVKIGWIWITAAFFLFTLTHSSLGPTLRPQPTRRRLQAGARYACITLAWFFVTQWFFGPGIVDRSFRWTGGKCQQVAYEDAEDLARKVEAGDVKDVITHAACKAIGGQWRGGHDISGHVFLLIVGSAMLWLELLPAVLRMEGLREARRIFTADGLIRRVTVESDEPASSAKTPRDMGVGIQAALGVAALSWWMLLMTAAYFHTWFEKLTGLLVAFTAIYVVYFLPRGVPALRQALGMPGV
ncbi:Acyl-coenzyme A diphosphatase fit1 [Fulvia fulva]|uniref:Acyl-coenzyme A diphosphatase SCS3 n=1 Tax=Passalora fulva TaxID=5499 RepID=A0A9Q8P3S2_PASFU|nr:Acyl-coenzyme A diphosphatase fit1 [Fulvia fulva]KAK4635227.1 Acyl-coenzyme A diphosphatase fit1 [Fulvia fulva]KAK4636747.1 Acyl-coenzyme A diphosphatase fit1 [Fulvia fulva]UJO12061.1 Acyl-coenzyme A diphosphatase fit1 [Fulvia fulva]WPV08583.1 Acyl-coenzyme A diphosphatase fit1 [Fulvia fulva]WPV23323.1 Acyl-coenzyme A diphosphatase fit1 [Fulvia fulva]